MANKFTKEQIINAKKLNYSRDVLEIILEENTLYSKKEIDKLVNDFLKKEVR